jgi:hypothetical protein
MKGGLCHPTDMTVSHTVGECRRYEKSSSSAHAHLVHLHTGIEIIRSFKMDKGQLVNSFTFICCFRSDRINDKISDVS